MSDEDEDNRYVIKYGKFGAYFHDTDKKKDMPLEQVLGMLNHLERMRSMNR